MGEKSEKYKTRSIPSIQITLTTFTDDENGQPSLATTGTVKIDGDSEDVFPRETISDYCSIVKSEYVKNLLLLSLGQFILWIAFDTLSSLQSSINAKERMGEISHAVVYGALAISTFFFPTVVIKRLGCKRTLVCATLGFAPYILANFYPSWSTLIPSAMLCGLSSGLLSPSRCVYINRISHRYARLKGYSVTLMNAWFFSVYTVFKQNTEIWGSVLSYHVLKLPHESEHDVPPTTMPEICGSDFCGDGLGLVLDLQFPPEGSKLILVAVFAALSIIAAFFLSFFLERLVLEETDELQKEDFLANDLLATCHQFLSTDQLLLLPLSLYTGLVEGFYNEDYKRVYVACAWGFPHIFKVSLCHGVISAFIALASGPCLLILGRATLFILAGLAHLTMFLALLIWKPDSEHTAGFFLIASALGIGNGVWLSQLVALHGVLFKENEEAGFSSFYFLNSLGFLLAYCYSSYLCTSVKIIIPMTILIIGLITYLAVEVRMVKKILFNTKRKN